MPLTYTWRGTIPRQPLRGECEGVAEDGNTEVWRVGANAPVGLAFVEVIIRGADHPTTRVNGHRVMIGRHLTVNYKTAAQQQAGTHVPAHVFISGTRPNNWNVSRVDWFAENADLALDDLDDEGEEDDDAKVEEK